MGKYIPLKLERNEVDDQHPERQRKSNGRLEPQRSADMRDEGADVHWVVEDVEWEASDAVGHEDAKVVAEVGAWCQRLLGLRWKR